MIGDFVLDTFIGDLHCHSVYSDGATDVDDIVRFAKAAGLSHLALSDHDNIAGLQPIQKAAEGTGLNIIPALEVTCYDFKRKSNVHMLCYYPKEEPKLMDIINDTVAKRHNSKLDAVAKLMEDYPITLEHVQRIRGKSVAIHQPHIIKALAEMGYTTMIDGEFLQKIFGKGSKYYVNFVFPDVMDVVKIIRDIGSFAVLAHPGQFNSIDLVIELCQKGLLAGVECFHPRNSKEVTNACIQIADEYNIIKTGGSDFHGFYSKHPKPIGTCTTDDKNIKRLLKLASKM